MNQEINVTERCKINGDIVLPTVVPIIHFPKDAKNANEWVSGGTGLLLDTGNKKLLVTADHVMESFLGEDGFFTLIGGAGTKPIDISKWKFLDSCKKRDICTVEVPDSFSPDFIGKRYCKPRRWPCDAVQKGEEAFFLGFPRAHRSGTPDEISCGIVLIAEFVASVGGPKFILVNEDSPRVPSLHNGFTEYPEHFGGMSGAPVFVHRDEGWLEPVGVFVEGDGKDSPFFCSYIDCVNADGSLKEKI
jgi:hypothetical protein